MKTTAAAALVGLFSVVVLAQTQAPQPALQQPRHADKYLQAPTEAPGNSAALTNLVKAQTEAIKALDARVTQLEARVKKLESPR